LIDAALSGSIAPSHATVSGGTPVVIRGDGLGSGKEGDVVTVTLAGVPASTILHPAADVVSVTASESGCWGRGKVVVSSQALETSTTVPGVTFAYWRDIPGCKSNCSAPAQKYLAFRAKLRLKGNEYPAPFNSQLVKDIAKLLDVSTNRFQLEGDGWKRGSPLVRFLPSQDEELSPDVEPPAWNLYTRFMDIVRQRDAVILQYPALQSIDLNVGVVQTTALEECDYNVFEETCGDIRDFHILNKQHFWNGFALGSGLGTLISMAGWQLYTQWQDKKRQRVYGALDSAFMLQ